MIYWVIGIGGIIGSLLRYGIGLLVSNPTGTLSVNLTGCFLLSWFVVRFCRTKLIPTCVEVGITTGLLGSFTTFSTFSVEVVKMIQTGSFFMAFLYALTSSIVGIFFIYVGYRLGMRGVCHEKESST